MPSLSEHCRRWWLSPRLATLRIGWRLLRNLAADFTAHGCPKSAAALTYMTLFAIVPLMTVVYAVFSMIPAFDGVAAQLQQMLFSHLVPETGQELQSYLAEFSSQARSLTGAGVGMLVITAYLMLTSIEQTFNDIWGVTRARKGLSSFLLYWAVLTIGPLLLGAGIGINTYLLSLKLFVKEHDALGLSPLVFQCLPFVFMALMFTLLFAAVPNCRVPVRYALIGGAITALLFELLKNLFSTLVASSSFQLVYGAFAAVPLFLLWINLVWVVVLGGAVLVRTLAERAYLQGEDRFSDMVAVLNCLALLRERSLLGRSISDNDCYRLGVGVVHWQRLRHRLERAGMIVAVAGGRYVLGRDLRRVSLWDLARILEVRLPDLEAGLGQTVQIPWLQAYIKLRRLLLEGAKEAFATPLESILSTPVAEASENQ
jgi:membrane protein